MISVRTSGESLALSHCLCVGLPALSCSSVALLDSPSPCLRRRYFSKAFSVWARQEKFSATLVNSLIWHTERDQAPAAWLVLSKVAGSCTKLDLGTVLEGWDRTVRSARRCGLDPP